jgi:ribose 5-phosphate isomerase B
VSRSHNDSNCLTLGGRTLSLELARTLVKIWLETAFEGGRHARRVQKIRDIEDENLK